MVLVSHFGLTRFFRSGDDFLRIFLAFFETKHCTNVGLETGEKKKVKENSLYSSPSAFSSFFHFAIFLLNKKQSNFVEKVYIFATVLRQYEGLISTEMQLFVVAIHFFFKNEFMIKMVFPI